MAAIAGGSHGTASTQSTRSSSRLHSRTSLRWPSQMTTGCTSPTTFQKHDDQATNSLGHTRSTLRGKDIVIIPGERIGKIHRSSALMVDISQMIVDEDSGLTGEGELERLQSGIFRGFTAAATGMRLNSMFAPLCQPSSSPAGLQLHAGSSAMPLSSVALSQFWGYTASQCQRGSQEHQDGAGGT